MTISGVILAAGRGERFGGRGNKVLQPLKGRPLLEWSLSAFIQAGVIDEIVVVCRPAERELIAELLSRLAVEAVVVSGGRRRQDSALAGSEAARGDYVLVHDAARPLVSPQLIRRIAAAVQRHQAVIPVIPVVDTVWYLTEAGLLSPQEIRRDGLVRAQTPQGFRRDLLISALKRAAAEGLTVTDDASAVLVLGQPVATVPGDPFNLKVTRPEDLKLAEALLGLVEGGG